MKTSENQPNVSTAQDAATTSANLNDSVTSQTQSEPSNDAQSLSQPPSAVEHFKKPHLKLFNNLMKPSLSLNCLPPNSPKEVSDEATLVERPYNSLKKKRDGEKELWRRSWESQASISTTTSHTGTSGGKNGNDFWSAYNFIMDTNLIDSCREATGEANKAGNDVTGEFRALKNNGEQMHHFDPSRSPGSSTDPRRLRRWLREMEAKVSQMPSITEAMKLNCTELKKFSLESANFYREIVAHGRVVAACIRSLEKENLNKSDDQPKSLDSVEHDSLDTIATTTSADSKRGENVLKALERRYHLLYLRAIEIQCMFEGLLERRSYLQSVEEFRPPTVDTSDEEPVAKVPKFCFDSDFRSCKPRDGATLSATAESDADSEGSEGEMECMAAGGDCVDGTQIVPVKQSTPPKTPSPNQSFETPQGTVIKRVRPKDFSKFHRSNRKSKNCAIFYYKHVDTDTDQLNNEGDPENMVSSENSEEEVWEFTDGTSNDVSPLTPDKNGNGILDDLECAPLELSPEINSPQQHPVGIVSNTSKLINTKESLRELVLEAESLVRQKINDRTSKTEYFFNEIIAKSQQQQRHKKMMEKSQKDTVKISRVQEWLKRHQETDGAIIVQPSPTTDCEASGEYSEESGHASDSSEEITDSVATCLQGGDHMQTSTEGLGSESTPQHKVTMRVKSTSRRHSDRPWSVSCLSQLTRNSRQSLIDDAKMVETSTALANFSISESALHNLSPPQYKNTSESDSKNCSRNAPSTVNSVGSKNSLRRRRAKLRKKSYSSNKRSESGSEIPTSDVSRNILRSMTKSESFSMGTALMEDLSVAISMMTIVKDVQDSAPPQKPESEDEQKMMKPDFKIGSLTNVYANPQTNLGSLAALATYNHDKNDQDINETANENMSSLHDSESMWDPYMEKYNSEAYSEDRDVDAARRLLEFGDDYRNFIDSQSDCCSSLSAANIDSMSPPRPRKNISGVGAQNISLSSNDNSMKMLRHRRIQEIPELERRRMSNGEDRKSAILEKLRQKTLESESSVRRRSFQNGSRPQSYKSSSSDHSDNELSDKNILKLLAECKTNLERTEALRMANPQLLRPEDYEEILATCRKNVECLEAILRAGGGDPKTLKELIASWSNLLNWSENAAVARRLQEEIIIQKQSLDSIAVENGECLDTEEAIRDKIQELNNAREDLNKQRSQMLKLNASVHSWLTRQEMQRNAESKVEEDGTGRTTQSDLRTFADDELHKHLKDEIVSLYAKWDSVNDRISLRLECLNTSLNCWKQFEHGLFEFQENLSKDRGALFGLKGAIEDGTSAEDLVDNVQQVSKLLSEKLENKIQQTISTNEDLLLHPETALQFIASSNGSLSDSGISDGGFSELSERERRLNALKKIAKQLESALSPSSEVLKTITDRMEAAENELKILQNTCRELIVRTSAQLLQQQGIAFPPNTNAQSQINVQIPIITIKGKSSKRSLPRRTKRKSPSSPTTKRATESVKLLTLSSNDEMSSKSDSELDESTGKTTSRWLFFKRIAKMSVPIQLAIVTLFCVACLLEPRCCDTLNNLSMSLTPQLRYVKGPPPT